MSVRLTRHVDCGQLHLLTEEKGIDYTTVGWRLLFLTNQMETEHQRRTVCEMSQNSCWAIWLVACIAGVPTIFVGSWHRLSSTVGSPRPAAQKWRLRLQAHVREIHSGTSYWSCCVPMVLTPSAANYRPRTSLHPTRLRNVTRAWLRMLGRTTQRDTYSLPHD